MSSKRDKFSNEDKKFMKLALNLASVRRGLTGDNPSVGCVIVKNDQIISLGQTGFNGRPHSEYNAIKNSHTNLNGCKMYVTLEPCNHYGKTPPCTKKIIKSGINEVIFPIDDIDKKVKGKTSKILIAKKIKVKKGLLKKEAKVFYQSYYFNRKKKLPYTTAKIAVSKNNLIYSDGFKRITDQNSDKFTHYLRYKNDALMVTVKTLNTDNSKLNCRLKGFEKFSPIRVILDKNLDIKQNSYVFKTIQKKNTIIFHNSTNSLKIKNFRTKGVILIKSKLNKLNLFNLKSILKDLYKFGVRNLLIEGGDKITKNLLKNKLINQFYLFKSSKVLPKNKKYQTFSSFNILNIEYINKFRITPKLANDAITLYKR